MDLNNGEKPFGVKRETVERKLGLGMSEQDKRVEELEQTLAGVMHFVDKWLDEEELENDEVTRADIAREKALQAIEARDARIQDLEKELQRRKFFGLMRK